MWEIELAKSLNLIIQREVIELLLSSSNLISKTRQFPIEYPSRIILKLLFGFLEFLLALLNGKNNRIILLSITEIYKNNNDKINWPLT